MYTRSEFALTEHAALLDFIDANSFGIVVGPTVDEPLAASHLPFLLDRERGRLLAHMARANPQWCRIESEPDVLVVFSGTHGYVSPRWYGSRLAVPTWNYEAVHVRGRVRPLEAGETLRTHLRQLVARHEGSAPQAWQIPEDDEYTRYLEGMERAIGGFEVPIERIVGKAKMSQNRPRSDRERVIDALRAGPDPARQALAARMAAALLGHPGASPGDVTPGPVTPGD